MSKLVFRGLAVLVLAGLVTVVTAEQAKERGTARSGGFHSSSSFYRLGQAHAF